MSGVTSTQSICSPSPSESGSRPVNVRSRRSARSRGANASTSPDPVRIRYASLYHEGLSTLPQVLCPPLRTDGSHIYLTYPIQVEDRDALNRFLMLECQDVTVQHLINTADADTS